MSQYIENIEKLASLARTVLDDPAGLPAEEQANRTNEERIAYAIDCLDQIMLLSREARHA